MAYQLEFGEERALRELLGRQILGRKGAAIELRRAYDAIMELWTGSNTSTGQPLEEYQEMYLDAFQSYNRGDLQYAEQLARAVKHLCRASWFDAKIKTLECHKEDIPHLPGLNENYRTGLIEGVADVQSRLSRLKLTGLADRFGGRARNHLQRIEAMPDPNSLLADTFMKAAYEYCMATEVLHDLEFRVVSAA